MGLLIILNVLNTLLLGVVVAKIYSTSKEDPPVPPTPQMPKTPPVKRNHTDFSDPYREVRNRLYAIRGLKGK